MEKLVPLVSLNLGEPPLSLQVYYNTNLRFLLREILDWKILVQLVYMDPVHTKNLK